MGLEKELILKLHGPKGHLRSPGFSNELSETYYDI